MLIVPLSFVLATHLSGAPAAAVPLDNEVHAAPAVFRFQNAALPPPAALTRDRFRRADNRLARKGRAACAGSFVGLLAGALVGAGIDPGRGDSGDMFGVMVGGGVGATIGGVAGWTIAR